MANFSQLQKKDITNYYDKTAFEYNFVLDLPKHLGMHFGYYDATHRTYPEASLNLNRVLSKKVRIKTGMRVLDAGCGIGGSSIWLAKVLGTDVTGVTLSEKECRRARAFAAKNQVSHLTQFWVKDYLHTGFADDSFDVVWAIESVCYANNKMDFLKEAFRILRPKGKLVVADGFMKKKNLSVAEKRLMQVWLNGWHVPNLTYIDKFARLLHEAGFVQVKWEDTTANVIPFSRWLARRASVLTPIAQILRFLRIFTRVQTDNGIAAINQYPALKQGLWAYVIFWATKPAFGKN